ncbi:MULTISPECIES: alpha/beta fold hydrolase [Leisingera]|jgi:pimeloyl-ACP methyl ester carboxylesterase|uniref:alpha/beta fold hydrolase n=1 Tax=Leisingera TaxID=191028 RepID=UPI001151E187|nr:MULTISPECIES: alpha/beta hydrolase [Leisingera]QDI75131.1 alpha/beta hydrolase [Leisingera aquaemixtae]
MPPAAPFIRRHGAQPFIAAVLHGGPGAAGEAAPVAQELAARGFGVLEPWQSETSVEGQISELRHQLETACAAPAVLIGLSWGAWLACLLAARHPHLAAKLVLAGCPPFEARFAAQIDAVRQARLRPAERQELTALLGGSGMQTPAGLARAVQLLDQAEACAPLPDLPPPQISFDRGIFQSVWAEAAELRRSGELLREAARIRCPVIALHGDQDPHPAAGVRQPLRKALPGLRFRLLRRCGHKPWIETHARAGFFQALEDALAPA